MSDNNKTPNVEMQIALRQVRTLDDPSQINQVILGMARQRFEHYCTTLVPAQIARSSSMAGRFELLHFFRRIVRRDIEPEPPSSTTEEQAAGDALQELAGGNAQPALPAGTDEQRAAGDALTRLAGEVQA